MGIEQEELSMTYTVDRSFQGDAFSDIVERTRKALSEEGFGVLTEIDVKATLKTKLDVDTPEYLILGACNPKMAHMAMQIEPRVGAMLPCNVIVRDVGDGGVEVNAIDPLESMAAIDNDELKSVAGDVRAMMIKVVENI